MTPTGSARSVRFGPFELDLQSRELHDGSGRTRLQDQPFELLRAMLECPGAVVTRETLRHRLWPEGTFVDFEHSLNAAIKRLRAALGDDADNPRFVETLPRRGYRFIAPLRPLVSNGAGEPRSSIAHHKPAIRLAVLPFVNMSDERSEEYFSDGLTEEMIAQVGALFRGRVGVIARWSSNLFKRTSLRLSEIGVALRADYLLEGSVRRDGERLRITATLVEAADETHLWSETYERQMSEFCASGGRLAVQTDVAARIARSLAIQLAPQEDTRPGLTSPDAYQALLKGRYFCNLTDDSGLDRSIAWFERAVAAAPGLAAAHAALARAQIARGEYYRERPRAAIEAAQATALRALDLDPRQCEAYVALGDATRILGWQWTAAEGAYAQAQTLNPSFVAAYRCHAVLLAALARHADAVRASERAFELDPLCLDAGASAAWVRYASGDWGAAIDYCRNTLDMEPRFVPGRRILGAAYLQAGRTDDALAELTRAAESAGGNPVPMLWLAHATAAAGDHPGAERLLAEATSRAPGQYVPPYHVALVHTGLGNHDAAFAALDTACADRDPGLANLAVEPRFAPLASDRRFAGLTARLRLS